jgi:hypothetical protein
MVKFVELDEKVKLAQQMEEDIAPVILINTFHVKPEDTDQPGGINPPAIIAIPTLTTNHLTIIFVVVEISAS